MSTRVLDWNGLVLLASLPPAQRVISVAGVPARVKKTLATDSGIFVHSLAEEFADEKWAIKQREHMLFLRQLVDAGQVTVDDDEDPWRMTEWQHRLGAGETCFVASCGSGDVDERGPIFDRDGRMHLACPAHWDAVMGVLGAQHAAAPDCDYTEVRIHEQIEPIRSMCVICGADRDTPHDQDAHTRYIAALPPTERSRP
jgi:hypothetical protein